MQFPEQSDQFSIWTKFLVKDLNFQVFFFLLCTTYFTHLPFSCYTPLKFIKLIKESIGNKNKVIVMSPFSFAKEMKKTVHSLKINSYDNSTCELGFIPTKSRKAMIIKFLDHPVI